MSTNDALDELIEKVVVMNPAKAAFLTAAFLFIVRVLSLPHLYMHYLTFESFGKLTFFTVDLRAHLVLFFAAAAVSGLLFYINWKAAKSNLKKHGFTDADLNELGSIYAVASVLSVAGMSAILSGSYLLFLEYINQVSFNTVDPIFNNNVGFYIFTLPLVYKILNFALMNVVVLAIANILLWIATDRVEAVIEENDIPFIPRVIVAGFIAIAGIRIYLSKYDLLTKTDGSKFLNGAGVNDIGVFPFWLTLAAALTLLLALVVFLGLPKFKDAKRMTVGTRYAGIAIFFVLFAFVFAILVPSVWSGAYYRYDVSSSVQEQQAPYLNYSIQYTRDAYGLTDISESNYSNNVALNGSVMTSPSITKARTFDLGPYEQYLQRDQSKKGFRFIDLDVDRYPVNKSQEQVVVSGRELNRDLIPQDWENQRLIWTEGYGAVIGSVNRAGNNSMPKLYSYDIPIKTNIPEFKLKEAGIRYGENPDGYIITNTNRLELAYPSSPENVYTTYNGTGGIPLGGFWKRLLIGWECGDLVKVVMSDYLTSESRYHPYTNIDTRIKMVAPFLWYDPDNSLFVDYDEKNQKYMTSGIAHANGYPYSDVSMLGDIEVNYVSDAVKVVTDATNGTMDFYIVNNDPIMQTYAKIYPGMFKYMDEDMPESQLAHVKYSEELFNVQSIELCRYHVQDIEQYFMEQDEWKRSNEISDTGESELAVPYNMVLSNKDGNGTSFVLVGTFNPADPGLINLVSLLSVNQDYPHYGEMELVKFDKSKNIAGPSTVDAYVNQDTEFTSLLTLWAGEDSSVVRGNTLVILVNGGVIYIKPMYISSTNTDNAIPQLAAVLVYYEDPISDKVYLKWGKTVQSAMSQIFTDIPSPVSLDGQENIQQGLSANVSLWMEIWVLNSNGETVKTISIPGNETFIVKNFATVTAVNASAAMA